MFPEYVIKFKKKGYKIIQKGDSYYLYKSTSKRVEGFKNPQPVNIYMGIITEDGLVKPRTRVDKVLSYEFGLCSYLLARGKHLFSDYGIRVIIKAILINIYGIKLFQCHYEKSYLSIIYPNVKIDNVTTTDRALSTLLYKSIDFNEYNQMLLVSAVLINNRWYLSNMNENVNLIMKKYNIELER
jgi:hypothetical protein